MSLFTLNIGNSRVQCGIWRDGRIQDFRQFARTEFRLEMLPEDLPLAAACVVPEARDQFAGRPIFWLSPATVTGLDLSLIDASTFGADRLANAIALAKLAATLPAICIDCGTAITCEVVDRNRALRGGAIAPGRRLLRLALHEHTAQLPLIAMSGFSPPGIGGNTHEAIRCGVDRGCLGLVREIIVGIRREIGAPDCPCVATGGDAEYFVKQLPELSSGGIDFTLRGIALAWELNHAG